MENYYLFENYFSIIMVYYLPQSAHIFTYAGNKQSGRIVSFCNLVHKKLKDIRNKKKKIRRSRSNPSFNAKENCAISVKAICITMQNRFHHITSHSLSLSPTRNIFFLSFSFSHTHTHTHTHAQTQNITLSPPQLQTKMKKKLQKFRET